MDWFITKIQAPMPRQHEDVRVHSEEDEYRNKTAHPYIWLAKHSNITIQNVASTSDSRIRDKRLPILEIIQIR